MPPGVYEDRLQIQNGMSGVSQYRAVCVDVEHAASAILFDYSMDSDPEWSCEGAWEFGRWAGDNGLLYHGYDGMYCYGYDLDDDYENNMAARCLVTPVLDFSGMGNIMLRFRERGGICANDEAALEISTNNLTWEPVWAAEPGIASFQHVGWRLLEYDLSAWATDCSSVRLRWRMGPTDDSDVSEGMYLDNVQITGSPLRDDLVMERQDEFISAVHEKGDVINAETVYGLRNYGVSNLFWSARTSCDWASVSPSSGRLNPQQEICVTVTVTDAAAELHASENGTLCITADEGGDGRISRTLPLTVYPLGENLILNPDFEIQDTSVKTAFHWYDSVYSASKGTCYGSVAA